MPNAAMSMHAGHGAQDGEVLLDALRRIHLTVRPAPFAAC